MGFLDLDLYDDLAKHLGATVARDRKQPSLIKRGVRISFKETHQDQYVSIRWRAELPPPGVPKFRLYPEGFQSFMSKLFGGQDVEIGHSALDLRFMVKARSPELVKQLWTTDLCDQLVALGDVTIEGDDREITLRKHFDFDQLQDPVPGCELLWALAEVDLYGRDVLRALPEASFHRDDGEIWLPGPNDVRMGFVRTDESVSIKARMVVEQDVEITDAIKRQFEQAGANVGRAYEDVVVVWSDHERDPARILRGVDLLRQLAGGVRGDGVFR